MRINAKGDSEMWQRMNSIGYLLLPSMIAGCGFSFFVSFVKEKKKLWKKTKEKRFKLDDSKVYFSSGKP